MCMYIKTSSNTTQLAQGSDPLPGESEADYIARQRALQEQVTMQYKYIHYIHI